MLDVGKKAPAFKLTAADGSTMSLKDFKGKKVLLWFFPKASTPGCTAEGCNLRDNYAALTNANVEVIGVSRRMQHHIGEAAERDQSAGAQRAVSTRKSRKPFWWTRGQQVPCDESFGSGWARGRPMATGAERDDVRAHVTEHTMVGCLVRQ